MRKLIKEVGKDKTVLLSTHILQEVEKMCNRVVIINKGEIVSDKLISEYKKEKLDIESHFQSLCKGIENDFQYLVFLFYILKLTYQKQFPLC